MIDLLCIIYNWAVSKMIDTNIILIGVAIGIFWFFLGFFMGALCVISKVAHLKSIVKKYELELKGYESASHD